MKQSYVFYDTQIALRQAIAAWLILLGSTTLFVIIGLALSQTTLSQEVVIGTAFLFNAPVVVGAHFYLYQRSNPMGEEHRFTKLIKKLEIQKRELGQAHTDLLRLKNQSGQLRVEVLKTRKLAVDRGRPDIVDKVDELLQRIATSHNEINVTCQENTALRTQIDQDLRLAKVGRQQTRALTKDIHAAKLQIATTKSYKRGNLQLEGQLRQIASQI